MRERIYLVFLDKRFTSIARRELKRMIHTPAKENGELSSGQFLAVSSSAGEAAMLKIPARSIFVNAVIPISKVISGSNLTDKSIIKCIESDLGGDTKFKLEALHIESDTEENAKTTEVRLGKLIESHGFTADLASPDVIFYVVFYRNNALIGKLRRGAGTLTSIDAFRRFNNIKGKVSRAEFKLVEALEYFNVDVAQIKNALDIGAAPGGWTKVLSKLGTKVTAVDNAGLDKSVLTSPRVRYIKEKAERVKLGKAKFDALLIDTNTDPETSSGIAIRFSKNLSRGACLILTVKLVGGSIEGHIKKVQEILKKEYSSIKFKKLQHNRMEVTCFAIKK